STLDADEVAHAGSGAGSPVRRVGGPPLTGDDRGSVTLSYCERSSFVKRGSTCPRSSRYRSEILRLSPGTTKVDPLVMGILRPGGRARTNSRGMLITFRIRLRTERNRPIGRSNRIRWPHAPPESADAAQTTAAIAAAAATPTPARRSAVAAALSVAPVVTMSSTRITGRPEAASAAPWRGATARLESAARRRWAGL